MGLRTYQLDPDKAIQERITQRIRDLSFIETFRDQPFEEFEKFQILYQPAEIATFFETIRPRFEGRSYEIEFEYQFGQITMTQMTDPMPEQEFIGKRALVLTIGFLVPWSTVE
jgi:hypothetical protein